MIERIRLVDNSAYILHTSRYRETSLFLEVLTEKYGRIKMLAKGARTRKRLGGNYTSWQSFIISASGQYGELLTVNKAEPEGFPINLLGKRLWCGLYINELLMHLLPSWQQQSTIFSIYPKLLTMIAKELNVQTVLRVFEKNLLTILGYHLPLQKDITTKQDIKKDTWYNFQWGYGPCLLNISSDYLGNSIAVQGATLLALHNEIFTSKKCLQDAKIFMRWAIGCCLGNKKLLTREIFG